MTDYNRVYNFSAGPSVLPLPVLEKVRDDLLNYQGSGQSVMEMSHRSAEFKKIIQEAEADLRDLMNIPDNYKCCFTGRRNSPVSMNPSESPEKKR